MKKVLTTLVLALYLTLGMQAQTPTEYYVSASTGSDAGDGQTWQTAFQTIAKACDAIGRGTSDGRTYTVYMAEGTYTPDEAITLTGSKTIRFIGGYPKPTAFTAPNDICNQGTYLHPTILVVKESVDASVFRIGMPTGTPEVQSTSVYFKGLTYDNLNVDGGTADGTFLTSDLTANGATVTMENCYVKGYRSQGAYFIYVYDGDNNTYNFKNIYVAGGAINVNGGVLTSNNLDALKGCKFWENTAPEGNTKDIYTNGSGTGVGTATDPIANCYMQHPQSTYPAIGNNKFHFDTNNQFTVNPNLTEPMPVTEYDLPVAPAYPCPTLTDVFKPYIEATVGTDITANITEKNICTPEVPTTKVSFFSQTGKMPYTFEYRIYKYVNGALVEKGTAQTQTTQGTSNTITIDVPATSGIDVVEYRYIGLKVTDVEGKLTDYTTCDGTHFVTVKVSPSPVIADKTISMGSTGTFSYIPVNGVDGNIVPAGTTYSWTATPVAGVTGIADGTSDQATGITGTLTNATYTEQTVVYTVNATTASCQSTFTVTVNVAAKAVWVGSTTDSEWTTPTNWQSGTVPTTAIDVEFATTANNGVDAKSNMEIPEGSEVVVNNLTNNTNFSTVVTPGASLTVNGDITGSEINPDKIVIKSDGTKPNGSFVVTNGCGKDIYATVEMYSKAGKVQNANGYVLFTDNNPNSPTQDRIDTVTHTWQYFGIPVKQLNIGNVGTDIIKNGADKKFWLRERKEERNDPKHFYRKWRKLC